MPELSVKLRPFPYPYKAGLAICSDIDECDLETFIRIHRFLNSSKHGLGLPVADSFFAVAREPHHLAYLNPDGTPRSREAEFIRQAVRDGLIDSLHAWGDFNHAPPEPNFLKSLAGTLTGDFTKAGLQIPVWINHGSENNRQNLLSRLHAAYQGDNPASPYYTVPFIKQLGIKYYWHSELTGWPLSSNRRYFKRIAVNTIKNSTKHILGKSSFTRSPEQITRLATEVKLRDGSPIIAFSRFARHPIRAELWYPTRHSLRHSLSGPVLNGLVGDGGYLIVYTHLAKPVRNTEPLFPAEDGNALKLLADYYRKGLIWVTPTSKLLNFWLMQNYLEWQAHMEDNRVIIDIIGLNDPVTGHRLPTVDELAGICFYSPEPFKTVIRLGGKELAIKIFQTDKPNVNIAGFDVSPPPATDMVEI